MATITRQHTLVLAGFSAGMWAFTAASAMLLPGHASATYFLGLCFLFAAFTSLTALYAGLTLLIERKDPVGAFVAVLALIAVMGSAGALAWFLVVARATARATAASQGF